MSRCREDELFEAGSSEVQSLEERVRELERLLGRKTMENEILREPQRPDGALSSNCTETNDRCIWIDREADDNGVFKCHDLRLPR
jgi:hypothetical protein